MSYRYWITAVALGLVFGVGLGQAQEETQGEQGQATTQEEPAPAFPIPLPVEIVSDKAAAKTSQRREAESRQHEIDDLVAQQGMNAATQAMNEATQRMADYALYSTVLIGFGTGLLIWTLFLTRQANRSAQAAVDVTRDIGQRQTRAYVCVPCIKIRHDRGRFEVNIRTENFGNTPAYDLEVHSAIALLDDPATYNFETWDSRNPANSRMILAPGADTSVIDELTIIDNKQLDAVMIGPLDVFVFGEIRYRDAFKIDRTTRYRFQARNAKGIQAQTLSPCPDGNDAT